MLRCTVGALLLNTNDGLENGHGGMLESMVRPLQDHELVQIVDAAFADAARRSGEHLVCRPGCTQCCIGSFAINALDAVRLRAGMAQIASEDPDRATRIRQRTKAYLERVTPGFPGDPRSGALGDSEGEKAAFEEFANDEPCPALDPVTGRCDVYTYRPMTCRIFGPPIRTDEGIGHCELCYHGASDVQVAACEMSPDPDGLESTLLKELEANAGPNVQTIVAYCLADEQPE